METTEKMSCHQAATVTNWMWIWTFLIKHLFLFAPSCWMKDFNHIIFLLLRFGNFCWYARAKLRLGLDKKMCTFLLLLQQKEDMRLENKIKCPLNTIVNKWHLCLHVPTSSCYPAKWRKHASSKNGVYPFVTTKLLCCFSQKGNERSSFRLYWSCFCYMSVKLNSISTFL